MKSVEEYLEFYRKKRNELKTAILAEQEIKDQLDYQIKTINNLQKEIIGMRKLITYMIDNDMDPVEAQLKTDFEDRKESLWNDSTGLGDNYSIISTGAGIGQNYTMQVASLMGSSSIPLAASTRGYTGAIGSTGTASSTTYDTYCSRNKKLPGV